MSFGANRKALLSLHLSVSVFSIAICIFRMKLSKDKQSQIGVIRVDIDKVSSTSAENFNVIYIRTPE